MKFNIKKQKKWEELTIEERVEYLRMEQDSPSVVHIWLYFGIIILFSVIVGLAVTNYYVTDLYYQTGYNLSIPMNQTVTHLRTTWYDFSNGPLFYVSIAVVLLYIYSIIHYYWKYRNFRKSIRKVNTSGKEETGNKKSAK